MSHLVGKILEIVRNATAKEPSIENSVHGLQNLPPAILNDLEIIYKNYGSIPTFAYLKHISDAIFHEVKIYLDNQNWHSSAD